MQSSGGPLSCAARNLDQLRDSPGSWAWVGVILGFHLVVSLCGGVDAVGSWYQNLGLSREGVLSGKIWQLASYGLPHGGWLHALLNALFILIIGSRVERMVGTRMMLLVVLAGVAGGGVFHLLIGSGLLVGLSGGCFALLLMLTTLSPDSRMFPILISGRSLGVGILAAELLLALIDPGSEIPQFERIGGWLVKHDMGAWFRMGHACHLGGGLAGWVFGRWVLRPRVTLKRLRRDRARREAG